MFCTAAKSALIRCIFRFPEIIGQSSGCRKYRRLWSKSRQKAARIGKVAAAQSGRVDAREIQLSRRRLQKWRQNTGLEHLTLRQ